MPVYHSVVMEGEGKGGETAKALYITPKIKAKNNRPGRFGTFAKILLGCTFALVFIFFIASLGQYLYETFGPKPDKSLETYDTAKQFQDDSSSNISRLLSSKFTFQIIAMLILAILGKFVWGQDE